MIDVAHMSQKTMEATIKLAEEAQFRYPLLNSHSGLRAASGGQNERDMLRDDARRIAQLGGVLGIGTSTDTATPVATWVAGYQDARSEMGGVVALGTDFNGFSPMISRSETPLAYPVDFAARLAEAPAGTAPLQRLTVGNRVFDLSTDGLAHYGMLPDFIQAVSKKWGGTAVANELFRSADATVKMWDRILAAKSRACSATIAEDQLAHGIDWKHGGKQGEQRSPMMTG